MRKDNNEFRNKLREKMNEYVHFVYKITRKYPKDEMYGVTSQFRRATLSIMLNHIEGFARRKPAVQLNFIETSYGSLQESKYLLEFSLDEKYIDQREFEYGINLADQIGAMLWSEIQLISNKINND